METSNSGDEFPLFTGAKPSSARQELCRVCPMDIIAPRPSSCSAKITLALARDKEALLEEVLDLKKAYFDQEYHLKLHKVHAQAIDQENNKLVKDVEELELKFGLEAPRMGGHRRLKTRIIGLKSRLMDKQNTCCGQSLELGLLRRDLREIEIERDIFAAEIERLQKVVRRLQTLHTSITNQNAEVHRLQKKIERLEGAKKNLINLMDLTRLNIKKANDENEALKDKATEAQAITKKAQRKLNELQEHSILLSGLLDRERREKRKMERKIRFLVSETRRFEQEAIAARNKALMASLPKPQTKKKKKKPKSPDSVDSNAMADLEEAFLRRVEEAAVEFIETVPASQPASPTKSNKSEEELQEQHLEFEVRKDCFTDKVEVAELKFLQAMEEIEYGKAMSRSKKQELAMQKKMLADTKTSRLATEEAKRRAEEEAKRLEEERKRLQEEAERLTKELAAFRAMGANGKRWSKEEVAISFGDDKLVPQDFKCQVSDKGAQIEIEIEIKSPTTAQTKKGWDDGAPVEAERLRKLAELEVERLRKLAEEETEQIRKQMEEEAARRKKEMEEEEAQRNKAMEDKEAQHKKEMEEDEARRKKEMEEEEARHKKEMEEDEARRKKEMEEDEARHKKEMEKDEARRKKEMEEDEARRKKEMEENEARHKKEMEADETRHKKEMEEDETRHQKEMEVDEARRKKEMEEDETRRRRAMEDEEAARRATVEEEARRRQAEFDEQTRKMQAELDAAKKVVADLGVAPGGETKAGFFDLDMHQAIKENIQDVLGHLENISGIITEKAEEQASGSGTKDNTS